ncbi:MAG: calcium/sodium antiporter [Candidatus Faecimonas sp.]|nr:calcium/sodium antiporter [Mycoplasmatota bacterium]MDY2907754.1 calcium/sodium antiporter [Candidatus Faecimonas sp.]
MLEVIFLLLGFIIIIKSSDILVDCASSLAIRCNIPKMLIALTIVAFGTCAPEVAISFQSVSAGNGTIAFANVIGSCIVNTFLIIGLAAIIRPIRVKHATIKKELPILLIITTGFVVLMLDSVFNPLTPNTFSRADGIILILLFLMFVSYIVQLLKKKNMDTEKIEPKYKNIFLILFLLIGSILCISLSSDVIVNSATALAKKLNVSEKVITMIVVVIGTSLPEMFMTITSARKKEFDMAIGNIIGTNIFNICIVLGLPIVIFGDLVLENFNLIDIITVFLTSFLLYIFARSEKEVSKKEGILMVAIFIAYYICLIIG